MPVTRPVEAKRYSLDQMEAALCIWEELDRRTRNEPERYSALTSWRDDYGTWALRHAAIELADHVEAIYRAAPAEDWDGIAYDWEIVPIILDLVYWKAEGFLPMLATGAPTAAAIIAGLRR